MARAGVIRGLLSALLGIGCATRHLPPPATPARMPTQVSFPAPPLRDGEGQVTLDVVPEAARVDLIASRAQVVPAAMGAPFAPRGYGAFPTATQYTVRPLCVTPCAVNLPLGTHELLFSALDPGSPRTSTAFVNISSTPSVVRHAMGRQSVSTGGLIGAFVMGGLGIALSLTGGLFMAFQDSSRPDRSDFTVAGGITLGVGAALNIGAIVLGLVSRPVSQPGTTVQWTPSGS